MLSGGTNDRPFRFISLRPPAIPGPTQTVPIEPSSNLVRRLGQLGGLAQEVVTKARELLAAGAGVVTSTADLAYGGSYANFITATSPADDSGAPAGLAQLIAQNFGQNAATLVASPGFTKDKAAVSDTLILVKLASTSAGVDVSGLNTALQAIAIVENVADGKVTATWHSAIPPAVPEYWRAAPTASAEDFSSAVSSTSRTAAPSSRRATAQAAGFRAGGMIRGSAEECGAVGGV